MLIPIPDLSSARRLLCIQPHYDDNDIAAGGTIAALAAAGCENAEALRQRPPQAPGGRR